MAHTDPKGGSYVIDRRLGSLGRLKMASGTTHAKTFGRINQMLTELLDRGRMDLLRAIRDRVLTPLQVFDAYRSNALATLPTPETLVAVKDTMTAWLADYECSERHRESLEQTVRYLTDREPTLALAALPARLTALRATMKAKGHARTFNLTRSNVQAFLRSTVKRSHPLYVAIQAIDPLKTKPTRTPNPQTPAQLTALVSSLDPAQRTDALMMAYTGMGPTEYWEDPWMVHPGHVMIDGQKRAARSRSVPQILDRVFPETIPTEPVGSYRALLDALDAATEGAVQPYDLRRSFATWMEAARIPRTRRKIYLGHGARDVTDLYERHEIDEYLAADAAKLRAYLVTAIAKPVEPATEPAP